MARNKEKISGLRKVQQTYLIVTITFCI